MKTFKKLTTLWCSLAFAAVLGTFGFAGTADAAFLNVPVPTNAYIVYQGIDWAWGDPCPNTGGCGDGDLSYQSTQGWSLPPAADLAIVDAVDSSNPAAFGELFYGPSGNVPAGGTDPVSGATFDDATGGACAAAYFNSNYDHCDSTDADQGAWNGTLLGANYANDGIYFDEQLYVRAVNGAVPEPATWALMLAGFGLIGFIVRTRASATVVRQESF